MAHEEDDEGPRAERQPPELLPPGFVASFAADLEMTQLELLREAGFKQLVEVRGDTTDGCARRCQQRDNGATLKVDLVL
jgi:hypothetical protein